MPCRPLFPSLCLLAWHCPQKHDLSSAASMLSCKTTLQLKPPWVASSYLATHWIGEEHSSHVSISHRCGPNTGSSLACSCSRPNLSNQNTPDPLWNTTHKVTPGCSPMECQYFSWGGNCKSQHSGVYHLLSPCCCYDSHGLFSFLPHLWLIVLTPTPLWLILPTLMTCCSHTCSTMTHWPLLYFYYIYG